MPPGRPREESASEAEERRKEQKRESYERCKKGEERKKSGPEGRDGEGDEKLVRRREMYAKRKEGVKERGRPRKADVNDASKRRLEQYRRSKEKNRTKTPEKLPLDLSFLGGTSSGSASQRLTNTEAGSHGEDPPSILRKTRVSSKKGVKYCYRKTLTVRNKVQP